MCKHTRDIEAKQAKAEASISLSFIEAATRRCGPDLKLFFQPQIIRILGESSDLKLFNQQKMFTDVHNSLGFRSF